MMFFNAKDRPLNANSGTLPDMGNTLSGWLQPITLGVVTKTVVNFQVVETQSEVSFQGVWQPFSARQLIIKPEGERAWKWYMLHAQIALPLKPDDVVTYRGIQYRVKADNDYSLYGYYQYELIEDWTGSGPEVES
jgi:hypothetical protein